jgi:hypothetical protein
MIDNAALDRVGSASLHTDGGILAIFTVCGVMGIAATAGVIAL